MFRAHTFNASLASALFISYVRVVRGPWDGAAITLKQRKENPKRGPNSPPGYMDVYRVRTCTNAYSAAPQSTRDGYASPGILQELQTHLRGRVISLIRPANPPVRGEDGTLAASRRRHARPLQRGMQSIAACRTRSRLLQPPLPPAQPATARPARQFNLHNMRSPSR